MEIISQLLWDTENDENTLGNIFEALVKFKNENGLRTRFDVFIRLLSESKNVILIDNVIDFIITIVSAPIDSNKRFALKEEFLQSGLQISFAVRKKKNLNNISYYFFNILFLFLLFVFFSKPNFSFSKKKLTRNCLS